MILGISVEQVIDDAATTSRAGREISFTFSSAGRLPAHLPALSGTGRAARLHSATGRYVPRWHGGVTPAGRSPL
jgi:hypothetical protein